MSIANFYRTFGKTNWILLASLYLMANTVVSFQNYFTALKNRLHSDWFSLFVNELPVWSLWLVLTPLILYINFRFPSNEKTAGWKDYFFPVLLGVGIVFGISNLVLVPKLLHMGYLEEWTMANYLPYFGYRFLNDCMIYIVISIIGLLIKSYASMREQEIKALQISLHNNQLNDQLTRAQLQALKLQLNPHFLFNTLNTISSLTLTDQKSSALAVTQSLSSFLRRTLEFEQEQLVPLHKEIEFFDLYLQIEQVRFADRLKIYKEVNPDCLELEVPNLLLQPLVENAVKHGIGQSKEGGEIKLHISCDDTWLIIKLSNDGKKLDYNWTNKVSVGLSNTLERLNKLYGALYSFNLTNRLDQKGVLCALKIPLKVI